MKQRTFLTLFVVAFVMRVFMIWDAPLWYDENFTYILARLPLDRMIAATAGDVHPPLWYLIEWAMYHLLPQLPAWAIRLPALTCSLLSLMMFYLLCEALHINERVWICFGSQCPAMNFPASLCRGAKQVKALICL